MTTHRECSYSLYILYLTINNPKIFELNPSSSFQGFADWRTDKLPRTITITPLALRLMHFTSLENYMISSTLRLSFAIWWLRRCLNRRLFHCHFHFVCICNQIQLRVTAIRKVLVSFFNLIFTECLNDNNYYSLLTVKSIKHTIIRNSTHKLNFI